MVWLRKDDMISLGSKILATDVHTYVVCGIIIKMSTSILGKRL